MANFIASFSFCWFLESCDRNEILHGTQKRELSMPMLHTTGCYPYKYASCSRFSDYPLRSAEPGGMIHSLEWIFPVRSYLSSPHRKVTENRGQVWHSRVLTLLHELCFVIWLLIYGIFRGLDYYFSPENHVRNLEGPVFSWFPAGGSFHLNLGSANSVNDEKYEVIIRARDGMPL